MKPQVRAAIYARVSTAQKQNPEMQTGEMREYCARRGWIVAGEFTDIGISGARESRPQLNQMLSACRRRKFDAVLVYRYDRFARSLRHLVSALDEFRSLGVDFVSLHEGTDTSSPNGRLIFGIFAAISEFERELIRERVKSGLAAARARGTQLGRPKRVVDINAVNKLRGEGKSWRKIASDLRIGLGTLFRAMESASTHNAA